jgi:hypothetical protein
MVAELPAVRVKMLVVLAGFVLNSAVTPAGKPLAAKVTLPAKPFVGFTVIVLVPLLPWITLNVLGAADSVKLEGAVTVRLIVVSSVKPPDVPVIVTVAVPEVAELLAVNVKMLVVVSGFALNNAVTPAGKPVAARVTLPAKPFVGFTVIVLVPLVPWWMLKVPGAGESVKPGAVEVTTSANFTGVIPVVDALIVTVPAVLGVV